MHVAFLVETASAAGENNNFNYVLGMIYVFPCQSSSNLDRFCNIVLGKQIGECFWFKTFLTSKQSKQL